MDYLLTGEESQRLLYRKLQASDFGLWLPFYADPESTRHWSGDPIAPHEACKKWFANVFYRYDKHLGGMNALITKTNGEFIGQCGLLKQTVDGIPELEIGYSLLPKYRRKGFASEAAAKCKAHAFDNTLSQSLISIIHVDNIASAKVALANGMTLEKTTTYKHNPVNIFRVFSK